MNHHAAIWLAVILGPSTVLAEDCTTVKDDAARLICWDSAARATRGALNAGAEQSSEVASTPTARDPKSWPFGSNTGPEKPPETSPRLHWRDKLNAPYEDGKALTLALTSSSGERVLKANVATIYELGNAMFGQSLQQAGWSMWVGAQWVKDSGKKPVDGRLLRLAALGTVGESPSIITLLALDFAQDNIAKTHAVGLRPEFMPVLDVSEQGTPYSKEGGYSAYIKYGAQFDRVRLSADHQHAQGNAAGLNIKANLSYYPGGKVAPLRLFFDAVRARDLYAGSNIQKRSSTYYDFGVEWMFTRPDRKPGSVAPTLSLHRVIGSNFLSGTAPSVQTVVAFGLKQN